VRRSTGLGLAAPTREIAARPVGAGLPRLRSSRRFNGCMDADVLVSVDVSHSSYLIAPSAVAFEFEPTQVNQSLPPVRRVPGTPSAVPRGDFRVEVRQLNPSEMSPTELASQFDMMRQVIAAMDAAGFDDDEADWDSEAEAPVDVAPGLLDMRGREAGVTVAAEWKVPVTIRLLAGPPEQSLVDWEDVVEFSMTTEGGLHLMPLFDGPVGPNLAHRGPGGYRLRLHATGRDETADAYQRSGMPDPDDDRQTVEQHLLEVWPAVPAQPTILKISSEFARRWAAMPRSALDEAGDDA
jgi:hypothetical protein